MERICADNAKKRTLLKKAAECEFGPANKSFIALIKKSATACYADAGNSKVPLIMPEKGKASQSHPAPMEGESSDEFKTRCTRLEKENQKLMRDFYNGASPYLFSQESGIGGNQQYLDSRDAVKKEQHTFVERAAGGGNRRTTVTRFPTEEEAQYIWFQSHFNEFYGVWGKELTFWARRSGLPPLSG
jgi:hypothetical protein